jgi:hypothetical protein
VPAFSPISATTPNKLIEGALCFASVIILINRNTFPRQARSAIKKSRNSLPQISTINTLSPE